MPRRGEKVNENVKNSGDNKLSQSTLYRKGIRSSELRNSNNEKKIKLNEKNDEENGKRSDGKNELDWNVAVFLFIIVIIIGILFGYYGLKYLIDEK